MIDFFRVTATSLGTSVRVILANLLGMGSEGDDNNAEPIDNAQWMQPLGMHSRPVIPSSGNVVTALVYRDGDEVHILHVWDKSLPTLGTSDVDQGDLLLYSPGQPSCTTKLDKNGGITAATKSGQPYTVNCSNGQLQIDANGNGIWTPASGQVVSIGAAPGSAQFAAIYGGSSGLQAYINNQIKAQFNQFLTDYGTHSHTGTAGPYPVNLVPGPQVPTSATSLPSAPAPSSVFKNA